MSYYSMWVMKPFPGKTKDAQIDISAMCSIGKDTEQKKQLGLIFLEPHTAISHLWLNSKTWKATAKPTIN